MAPIFDQPSLSAIARRCAMADRPAAVGCARLPKGEVSASYSLALEDGGRAVLKIYWRRPDPAPLAREARAIDLLRQAGDVPVAAWSHFDSDGEALGHPSLLSAWLPGGDGDDVFAAASPADAALLLHAAGRTLRAIHAAPTDGQAYEPQRWRAAEEAEFYGAIDRLREQAFMAPSLLDEAEEAWDSGAGDRAQAGPTALLHGDYQLWNLRADPESLAIVGVLDLENSTLGPAYIDFRDLELNLFVERPALRRAFCSGYGLDELEPPAVRHLRLSMLARALSLLAAYRGAAPMVPRSMVRVLLDRLRAG